jgi:hypothetical protein
MVTGPRSEEYYSVGPQVRAARGGEEQCCSYRGSHALILLIAVNPVFQAHAVTDAKTAPLRFLDIS